MSSTDGPSGWPRCSPSTPTLERELADPAVHADQAAGPPARPPLRRSSAPIGRDRPRAREARGDLGHRPRAGRRGRVVRGRGRPSSRPRIDGARRPAARAAAAQGPRRRQGRHPRDQGGGGRRRVGAVRRRPAADVPALRRAAGLDDRDPRRRASPTSAATRTSTVAVQVARRRRAGVWRRLKYEGGVHRVQRVPVTESPGPHPHLAPPACWCCPRPRRSTSQIDPNDLRIDVFRSSGPGGQSVNTTDSAVRITHLPTGIVVSCRTRRASCRTGRPALRVLRARLLARGPGGGRRGGVRRAPLPGPHGGPLASGCAPTTSRRTGSPTTGSATRPTTSTRCSTATWTT